MSTAPAMPSPGVRVMGVEAAQATIRAVKAYIDSPKPMQGLCEEVAVGIKARTKRAVDSKGQAFKRLSPKYRKWKQAYGKSGEPDLDLMGDLLNALAVNVPTPKHGVVFIKPMPQSKPYGGTAKIQTDTLANVHHFGRASIKMPARPFMGVSVAELQKLVKKFYEDAIVDIIRQSAGNLFGEPGRRKSPRGW